MSFSCMHSLTCLLLGLSTLVMLSACLRDIAARSIPNWMSIAIAALGLTAHILDGGSILPSILSSLAVFMAAAFCWRRGWMGGGDVKLLGAAATTVPPAAVLNLITLVALTGGVLALIYLAGRWIIPAPRRLAMYGRPVPLAARIWRAECWRIRRGCPLPYACAIAAGAILSQCITGV